MNHSDLKTEVATCVRMLEHLGLIDFSGHVSTRVPGKETILINAWGASRHRLQPGDIVEADLDGKPLDPDDKIPSEIHIHTAIYRRRPGIQAVSHLHPPISTAISVAGKPYLPVNHHGAIFAEGVPVHDDCRHVNTRERGEALAVTLADKRAVLMRGHGAVVVAESVKGVFFGSVYLEDNARLLLEAYKMGEPQVLRTEELAGGKLIWRQPQFEKIWNYYLERSGVRFS